MRRFANSNKVNYGIGLALLGILVFSLMVPVEGMADKTEKKKAVKKEGIKSKVEKE
jgi:hypothetical protein